MKKVKVSFDVAVPFDMSVSQIREWVGFAVGERASMKVSHPFMNEDVECVSGSFDIDVEPSRIA